MDGHEHYQIHQQVRHLVCKLKSQELRTFSTDSTVRIVKMNNIDGEYIALGRQTTSTGLALTPFGTAQNNAFNVTGSGIQENEFQDGFRMAVQSTQPMTINTNVNNGISTTMLAALPPGTQSVSKLKRLG